MLSHVAIAGESGRAVAGGERVTDEECLRGRRILLGVSGGIAAYKACELVRRLVTGGAQVQVLMTRNARHFIGPLTLETLSGRPVLIHELGLARRGSAQGTTHIRQARWGEVLVLAPATAALVSRLATGAASDLVSTVALAFRGPVVVAPAMNTAMLEHPATRANLDRLAAWGYHLVPPRDSELACGEKGSGALAELDVLLEAIAAALAPSRGLSGVRVLVTAGPTREPIDPVRYISNGSSGRMGLALAREAHRRGARVTCVHGPIHESVPEGVEAVSAPTVHAMLDAVMSRIEQTDVLIAAAAPADYVAESVAPQKIKKGVAGAEFSLKLVRAPDILGAVSRRPGALKLRVGFALETQDLIAHARRKLTEKRLDLIVANDETSLGAPATHIVILAANGEPREVTGEKDVLAAAILDAVQESLKERA